MIYAELSRFASVRDLYAAFPTAAIDVGFECSDQSSAEFIKRLQAEGDRRAALSYCAYLLGRREAVWWASCGVRHAGGLDPHEALCLDAAEAWVYEPNEEQRQHALGIAARGRDSLPAVWVARAAGLSGGNLSQDPRFYHEPPPQATAQCVRAALLMALPRIPRDERSRAETEWIEAALSYAANGQGSRP